MSHQTLGDLGCDAGTGELCAQGGSQGVEIDHTPVLVFRDDASIRAFGIAFADQYGFAILREHEDSTRDASVEEVVLVCAVGDGLREHHCCDDRRKLLAPAKERVAELRVHRQHIDPLGLSASDGDGVGIEVDIGPSQALEISLSQTRESGRQIPRLATVLAGDSNQACHFIVGEGASHPESMS
ncbi:MAG: hypothetical protein AAFR76_13940 [Planctomycetota bacterium]